MIAAAWAARSELLVCFHVLNYNLGPPMYGEHFRTTGSLEVLEVSACVPLEVREREWMSLRLIIVPHPPPRVSASEASSWLGDRPNMAAGRTDCWAPLPRGFLLLEPEEVQGDALFASTLDGLCSTRGSGHQRALGKSCAPSVLWLSCAGGS